MYSNISSCVRRRCSTRCHGVYSTFGARSLIAHSGKFAIASAKGWCAWSPRSISTNWLRSSSVISAELSGYAADCASSAWASYARTSLSCSIAGGIGTGMMRRRRRSPISNC